MPNIPQTWLSEAVSNTTTLGTQTRPRITQLTNGNMLVCWDSDRNTGAGEPAGYDVLGQLYGPMGIRIGTEFRLNINSTANGEQNGDIAALPGGGFIVTYEDQGVLTSSIRIEEFDATGMAIAVSHTVAEDITDLANPSFNTPSVAVSGVTSALVAYVELLETGESRIAGRIYDPSSNTYGSIIPLINQIGDDIAVSMTVLNNGNYVVAATSLGPANDAYITYRIISANGANVRGETQITVLNGNGENDRQPSVTGLVGGGFVIAWTNTDGSDTDVLFRVYAAAGAQVGSGIAGINGALDTSNNNEPAVIGLADGSFVIAVDNDATNVMDINRFSATGAALGGYSFAVGGARPSIAALADGRFAISWESTGGNIGLQIFDPRDAANTTSVYGPDGWQIGTIGADTILMDNATAIARGHDGNDTITLGNSAKDVRGDAGDDQIIMKVGFTAGRSSDGGAGIDMSDWSMLTAANLIFDLQAGTVLQSGVPSLVEEITGFENLSGTQGADSITGTDQANGLFGNAGNDRLFGGAENDSIFGGAGNDTLNGGTGGDTLVGGADNDLYFIDIATDVVTETAGGGTSDRIAAGVNYVLAAGVQIEVMTTSSSAGTGAINLTGNTLSQNITGNAGINVLSDGGGSADTLAGYLGNDTYIVRNAGTIINEATGQGTADRVALGVSFVLASNDSIELMGTTSATGTGSINLTGNALIQSIVGNAGANRLNGKEGSDTLTGLAGADTFVFDTALGASNVDKITDFSISVDKIQLENAIFGALGSGSLAAGAFAANLSGQATDGLDRIIYDIDGGGLYYDADGNGAGLAYRFATLSVALDLRESMFQII